MPAPQQPFDISGLYQLQSQYLTDLSNVAAAYPSADVLGYINGLQSSLNVDQSKLQNAINSAQNISIYQQDMDNIVSTEQQRLAAKQYSIDAAIASQKRTIELNDSYRKRYSAYTNVLVTLVICLAFFTLVIFARRWFPFIPSAVFDVLVIIIVATGIIYIGMALVKINGRERDDYDVLNLPGPAAATAGKQSKDGKHRNGTNSNNLFGGSCSDGACCAKGTSWDAKKGQCIVKKDSSREGLAGNISGFTTKYDTFTTLSKAYSSRILNVPQLKVDTIYQKGGAVAPFVSSEYEHYGKA
jgi:hypothetical protein